MSVKHVKEYYQQVCDQYHEMLENIQDEEKELEQGIVPPEFIDQLKEQIKPIKDNYMTISWIMYLLNQPNKKEKIRPYQKRMQNYLNTLDKTKSTSNTLKENQKVLNEMKKK